MASSDIEIEIYKNHVAGQEKQTYFLLAAVGACIGFAITQTKDMALHPMQAPLGAAVAFWGLSFLAGCRHVQARLNVMFVNMELLKLQAGRDPMVGRHPEGIAIGTKAFKEAIQERNDASISAANSQFWFLVLGVVCYLAWHILEMWSRT